MLPNPFQKPLTEFKDTDPLKNREIVRELLGPEGVHKYRKILGDNSDTRAKREKEVSKEDLLVMAETEREKFLNEVFKPNFEKLIEREFATQIKSLQEINFLETRDGRIGFTAIDNNFYEVPSVEEIKNHFLSNPNIKQKVDQGFTRLLIVPFGALLKFLVEKTETLIRKHKIEGKLLDRNGKELIHCEPDAVSISTSQLMADVSGELRYYSDFFDWDTCNGQTKKELLSTVSSKSPFLGYHILLLQQDTTIPEEGAGVSRGGRRAMERGKTPHEYLKELRSNPVYVGEQGLTPEDWLALFSTNLNQNNTVIDDTGNGVDGVKFLIGSYFYQDHSVPLAHWSRDKRYEQARIDGRAPTNKYATVGPSSAVG